MICPQTKVECKSPTGCGAFGCSVLEDNPPPKPTIEDIERLVDEFGDYSAGCAIGHPLVEKSRAALLAAIHRVFEN